MMNRYGDECVIQGLAEPHPSWYIVLLSLIQKLIGHAFVKVILSPLTIPVDRPVL